jgi:hypothetical protein
MTWQATHFGIRQKLTSKLRHLTDQIILQTNKYKGIFKSHSPFGLVGKLFNRLVLTKLFEKITIGCQ